MKKLLSVMAPIVLVLIGLVAVPPPAPTGQPVFNVVDFGAIGDGNPANAAINTAAFQAAINAGGTTYVPVSKGFCVNNGVLTIRAPGAVIKGEASMGCVPEWGPTSTIIGRGPGHTITVAGSAGGATIKNVAFDASDALQKGADSYLYITATQVTVSQVYMDSPNNGISVQFPPHMNGEFWANDILMGGDFGVSGISLNVGNAAAQMRHILMYANDPQPQYGILVTSCGELMLSQADVDNCGSNLALVPGLGGTRQQYVMAVKVSDSFLDNGNGPGNVLICPFGDAFVENVDLVNIWTSSVNNGGGTWNTNGFTFDGSQSVPFLPNVRSVERVTMVGCLGQCHVGHCGLFAKKVHNLSVSDSTFGGTNYDGIRIAAGCTETRIANCNCGDYVAPPFGQTFGGNKHFGISLDANPGGRIICTGNLLGGNGAGGLFNQQPTPFQIIGLNLQ